MDIEAIKKILDEKRYKRFAGSERFIYSNDDLAAEIAALFEARLAQVRAECKAEVEQTIKADADRCAGYMDALRQEVRAEVLKEVESASCKSYHYSPDGFETSEYSLIIDSKRFEALRQEGK